MATVDCGLWSGYVPCGLICEPWFALAGPVSSIRGRDTLPLSTPRVPSSPSLVNLYCSDPIVIAFLSFLLTLNTKLHS